MKTFSFIILAGLFAALAAFPGCTVGGLLLGAAIDSRHNDDAVLPIGKLRTLKPDDNILVKLQNGLEDEGDFVRVDTMRLETYELTYNAAWKLTTDCYLPSLHEQVEVALDSSRGSRIVAGEFLGFDEQSIRIRKDSSCIPISYSFRNVSFVSGSGKGKLSNPELIKLSEDRRLPLCTFVALRTMYGISNILMDDISYVQLKVPEEKKSNLMRTLAVGGAIIDAVLIMVIFKVDVTSFLFSD